MESVLILGLGLGNMILRIPTCPPPASYASYFPQGMGDGDDDVTHGDGVHSLESSSFPWFPFVTVSLLGILVAGDFGGMVMKKG